MMLADFRPLVCLAFLAVLGLCPFLGSPNVLSAEEVEIAGDRNEPPPVDFNQQIRPIFTQYCSSCHGGVKQAGDVSFVYPDQVLPPDGWIIEPGEPEASVLMERVTTDDPDLRMPPPRRASRAAARRGHRIAGALDFPGSEVGRSLVTGAPR